MVIGVDEAGRGAWAGPLAAAAVVLKSPIVSIKDSKLLTSNQRFRCAEQIMTQGIWALGWTEVWQIDKWGMTEAVRFAMRQALVGVVAQIEEYQQVIVDGPYNFLGDMPKTTAIVKADTYLPCVSAAGIIAKTHRDLYMQNVAEHYPRFGFDKHVGYGTAHHRKMIGIYGPTPIHRQSFRPIAGMQSQ